ncbi:stage II sporulation protein M [Methanolobus sp.]|uniref:stage II sporulation protein M n=1 Tax=Methanolobus sp. TaxID=1874737 RepID=UPI0025D2B8E7|nr:stage II sporulation protein M [Methanolobus sp.]
MINVERRENLRAYLTALKPYIVLSTIVFVLSIAVGYITYGIYPEYAMQSISGLEELVEMLEGLSPLEIMLLIFINNTIAMFIAILFGTVLGIVPLLVLVLNGFIIGTIVRLLLVENGLAFIVSGLVPHGIIEIPLLLLSTSIGMRIGYEVLLALAGKPSGIKNEFIKGMKFFFYWMVPLIFIAALIETFITPVIMYLVAGT